MSLIVPIPQIFSPPLPNLPFSMGDVVGKTLCFYLPELTSVTGSYAAQVKGCSVNYNDIRLHFDLAYFGKDEYTLKYFVCKENESGEPVWFAVLGRLYQDDIETPVVFS